MIRKKINRVGKCAVIALALGLVVMLWMESNASALRAQTSNPPTQQNEYIAELQKKIAGQENKPAEEVFKNVQLFKGIPAGRLLRVMELAFSRSLGVNCTHCHVVGEWEKEDQPTKQIAREMWKMMMAITNDQLKNIKDLKGPNPAVNCTTCHRGEIKPALNLPLAK
jgi:hypothetical protein